MLTVYKSCLTVNSAFAPLPGLKTFRPQGVCRSPCRGSPVPATRLLAGAQGRWEDAMLPTWATRVLGLCGVGLRLCPEPSQDESRKMASLWPSPAHDRNIVTSALPTASTSSVCWVGWCSLSSPNTSSGRWMNLEKLARLVKRNGIIKFSVDSCGEGKDSP